MISEAVTSNGGVLLKSKGEGDSTFSVFKRPTDAAAAALGVQRGDVRRAVAGRMQDRRPHRAAHRRGHRTRSRLLRAHGQPGGTASCHRRARRRARQQGHRRSRRQPTTRRGQADRARRRAAARSRQPGDRVPANRARRRGPAGRGGNGDGDASLAIAFAGGHDPALRRTGGGAIPHRGGMGASGGRASGLRRARGRARYRQEPIGSRGCLVAVRPGRHGAGGTV